MTSTKVETNLSAQKYLSLLQTFFNESIEIQILSITHIMYINKYISNFSNKLTFN